MSIGSDSTLVKVNIEPYSIDFIQLPKYDNNTYKQSLVIKNEISDIFKKTGNLQNSKLGNITNNPENYIVQSLKEQDYKVQPGDILTYKISIDASNLNNVPLQNLQLSQILDRSFDLIPDTLKIE
jgi:uncharacterized repeat protein (TIGR01451 family)